MHGLIHRKDKTLSVQVDSVQTRVRIPRKKKVILRPWPVIYLSNWVKECFENKRYGGFFFLGGHTLDNWDDAQKMLKTFWDRYSNIDPNVPANRSTTIPIYLHGDEGRGLAKRPLLVISYQPVMGWTGGGRVPSTKYPNKIQGMFFN